MTDEDVENELTAARKKNGRLIDVEDGAIEDGDNTIIDFTGYIDDKTFDGGAGTDYPLVIGSHSFIEGFEDQLIGKKKGETCDVNVTFPAEYHADELAGKPAKFVVTIKEVKRNELPELNDEFASEVSDFDTLDEYKKDIAEKVKTEKEQAAKTKNENRVEVLSTNHCQLTYNLSRCVFLPATSFSYVLLRLTSTDSGSYSAPQPGSHSSS